MTKIKEQETKFNESHKDLVDLVKQKHTQFDFMLERMIHQSEMSSVGDRTERQLNERRPSS